MRRYAAVLAAALLVGSVAACEVADAAREAPADRQLSRADSLEHWYALGMNAHHLCAGLWVVGRDHRRSPAEATGG